MEWIVYWQKKKGVKGGDYWRKYWVLRSARRSINNINNFSNGYTF